MFGASDAKSVARAIVWAERLNDGKGTRKEAVTLRRAANFRIFKKEPPRLEFSC
jgi:hypothetical protein